MHNKLVIIGAGGHGKVVADIALKIQKYEEIVFLDDNQNATECLGFPIVGTSVEAEQYIDRADFFVAIGKANHRKAIMDRLEKAGAVFATLIHPNASIGKQVSIGCGTVVMAGAVINSDTLIGKGCIINTCASVDHDCRVGDYVHVSVDTHLCGTVNIGDLTLIGAGATVQNNVTICAGCIISTGAVVIRNIEEKGIYMGVPAKKRKRKKICFVTTISATIKAFLIPFATYLYEQGNYDITFICDTDETLSAIIPSYMHYIPVEMKRGISVSGVKSIFALKEVFEKEHFDIIQYSTPNAAFYASIAAKMAKVKNRLYCQWGIRYMGFEGATRKIFKSIEKIVCRNSTHIESESFNLYEFSLEEKLYKKDEACVIWNGSASGVDLTKYDILQKQNWRESVRRELGIKDDEVTFGYAGRITRDKGINELLKAFQMMEANKNIRLLLVGTIDGEDTLDGELLKWAQQNDKISWVDWTSEMEKYFSAMDVFVSPSYREGFGLVVIEAEAMGIPAIVSDVPGQVDAILENQTGLAVEVKNATALAEAMVKLMESSELRCQYGKAARAFVEDNYEQQTLFKYLMKTRDGLLR